MNRGIMALFEKLPFAIIRNIQELLTQNERLRFPIKKVVWVRELRFPHRYPLQPRDIECFIIWLKRRHDMLCMSVEAIQLANFDHFDASMWATVLEQVLLFPRVAELRLLHFRHLLFRSIGLSTHLPVRYYLSTIRSIRRLHIDPPLLLHLHPPAFRCGILSIGITTTHYSCASGDKYSAQTPIYPLKRFVSALIADGSNGFIDELRIGVNYIPAIYHQFDFLFLPGLCHHIQRIHFHGQFYAKDRIVMSWRQHDVDYTVSTAYEMLG